MLYISYIYTSIGLTLFPNTTRSIWQQYQRSKSRWSNTKQKCRGAAKSLHR